MNRLFLRTSILLNIVFATVALCQAQNTATKDEAKKDDVAIKRAVTEHWLSVSDKLAKDYAFTPVGSPDSPFQLHDKAIFRHTQTVRGDDRV